MRKTFIMFRDGRRLRAAHLELPRLDAPLLVNGRRFAPAGSFVHLSHVTGEQKRLLGFMVDSLEHANTSPEWRAWWDTFDNREILDFWQAYLFLSDPMPADWHDDGALLVGGGWVFRNEAEFILAIPDENGYCFRPGEPTEFWRGLGFELSRLDVTLQNE